MPIKYFPNSVHKKNPHAIDRVLAKRQVRLVRGYQDVTSSGLDVYVTAQSDWQINSIKFNFSNSASRSYSVTVASGLSVIKDLNDSLWFHVYDATQGVSTLWQKIILSPGFYTGSTLAAELQTQLNANSEYATNSWTFTVTYSATTGLFTITPTDSNAKIRYIQTNNTRQLSDRDSMGGYLLGLTADTAFASNVVSNTTQFGLNAASWIIDENNSDVTSHLNNDLQILSVDQGLHFVSNTAPVAVTYEVTYEEIV